MSSSDSETYGDRSLSDFYDDSINPNPRRRKKTLLKQRKVQQLHLTSELTRGLFLVLHASMGYSLSSDHTILQSVSLMMRTIYYVYNQSCRAF